jgi:hypothetical protein
LISRRASRIGKADKEKQGKARKSRRKNLPRGGKGRARARRTKLRRPRPRLRARGPRRSPEGFNGSSWARKVEKDDKGRWWAKLGW